MTGPPGERAWHAQARDRVAGRRGVRRSQRLRLPTSGAEPSATSATTRRGGSLPSSWWPEPSKTSATCGWAGAASTRRRPTARRSKSSARRSCRVGHRGAPPSSSSAVSARASLTRLATSTASSPNAIPRPTTCLPFRAGRSGSWEPTRSASEQAGRSASAGCGSTRPGLWRTASYRRLCALAAGRG